MDDFDYLDDELAKPSVFTDESKLASEYVPRNLLFRSDNLKTIVQHFRSIFTDTKLTRKMVITGPVGSGKTSIAKKFGQWVNRKSINENYNIRYIHVNCRRNKSQSMILHYIARELNPHIPSRGYSADELMEMIVEILEGKEITLLLVLDEVDYVSTNENNNLLYSLSRTADERGNIKHKLAIILISQSISFLESLDASTKSSLSPSIMRIKPYTKPQLRRIIEERVKEGFIQGAVSRDSIELCAEIAVLSGDARRALELMWYGGKYADKENSTIVYPDHIRQAKGDIAPSILRKTIEVLSEHKLMLLLGIARQLRYTRTAHITTGNAVEAYQIVCEEYTKKSRKQTQIWEYLREFENLSILVTQKSGLGQRGKTRFISIQDVSVTDLEIEVSKRLQKLEQKSMLTY